jgi:hypothetical protein
MGSEEICVGQRMTLSNSRHFNALDERIRISSFPRLWEKNETLSCAKSRSRYILRYRAELPDKVSALRTQAGMHCSKIPRSMANLVQSLISLNSSQDKAGILNHHSITKTMFWRNGDCRFPRNSPCCRHLQAWLETSEKVEASVVYLTVSQFSRPRFQEVVWQHLQAFLISTLAWTARFLWNKRAKETKEAWLYYFAGFDEL